MCKSRFEETQHGDRTILKFLDRRILDEVAIRELGQELYAAVDDDGKHHLILDFSSMFYMSSAFLGKLITLNSKIQLKGGFLVLCGISPEVYENFEITALNRTFKIVPDLDTALGQAASK